MPTRAPSALRSPPQCTKQLLSERFGRGSRTVDLELETQIELLRDTQRKYESVLGLARALTSHFYSLVQTQHALADAFSDLSQKSPELQVGGPPQTPLPPSRLRGGGVAVSGATEAERPSPPACAPEGASSRLAFHLWRSVGGPGAFSACKPLP